MSTPIPIHTSPVEPHLEGPGIRFTVERTELCPACSGRLKLPDKAYSNPAVIGCKFCFHVLLWDGHKLGGFNALEAIRYEDEIHYMAQALADFAIATNS